MVNESENGHLSWPAVVFMYEQVDSPSKFNVVSLSPTFIATFVYLKLKLLMLKQKICFYNAYYKKNQQTWNFPNLLGQKPKRTGLQLNLGITPSGFRHVKIMP